MATELFICPTVDKGQEIFLVSTTFGCVTAVKPPRREGNAPQLALRGSAGLARYSSPPGAIRCKLTT
jgi:hypothetical protein